METRGWAYATPDDPHHVSILLQIRGTALDEGSTAFRPQVCADCLQRGTGGLQHLAGKRGACLWSCLSPSEVTSFHLLQSVMKTNALILQLDFFWGNRLIFSLQTLI